MAEKVRKEVNDREGKERKVDGDGQDLRNWQRRSARRD